MSEPLVSCLCPTHGRFSKLREALACFLAQDYPRKELIILNHHPEPLALDRKYPDVQVFNGTPEKHDTLGKTRNALLRLASGQFFRMWDDDDWYMPWTISQGVEEIGDAAAWQPYRSWCHLGSGEYNLTHRRFEPSILIRTSAVGRNPYDEEDGWADGGVMRAVKWVGGMASKEMGWASPFVAGWADGLHHASGRLGEWSAKKLFQEWRAHNQETGNGSKLSPAPMHDLWMGFVDSHSVWNTLGAVQHGLLRNRLLGGIISIEERHDGRAETGPAGAGGHDQAGDR